MSTFRIRQTLIAILLGGSAVALAQDPSSTPTDRAPNERDSLRLATAQGVPQAAPLRRNATIGSGQRNADPGLLVVDHSKPETARDSQADAPETARDHEDPRTLPETAADSQVHAPETARDSPVDQPETARDSQKNAPETAVDDPRTLPETATDALRASDAKQLKAARAAAAATAHPNPPPR